MSTTTTTTTSTTSTTTTSTITLYRQAMNLLPQAYESALRRRMWDERVEMFGLPCRILHRTLKPAAYDAFGDLIVTGGEPTAQDSRIILIYQEETDRAGDDKGKVIENYPYVAECKFSDAIQKGDLIEIYYQYAEESGRIPQYSGPAAPPTTDMPTRFKVVNRRMTGVRADYTNKYYLAPTEETWS